MRTKTKKQFSTVVETGRSSTTLTNHATSLRTCIIASVMMLMAIMPFMANAQNVCEIGTTGYTSLLDAISAAPSGGSTIKLLTDINLNEAIIIGTKKIIIELNGKNLTVSNPNGAGLHVNFCTLIIDDTFGNGECNITGAEMGVYSYDSTIKITGNVMCEDVSNTYTSHFCVYAVSNSSVTVTGNVECTGTGNSCGVYTNDGGFVTVDGTITSYGTYIKLGPGVKTRAEYTTPTTKAGYLTYTGDGNTVWVKQPETTPPIVLSVTPTGTGADINGNVVITFSEEMNTIHGTVQLNSLTALTGGSWNSPTNTIITIPYGGLDYSTSYTVNISGFDDVAGNTIEANSSNSFTSSAAVCFIGSTLYTSLLDAIIDVPTGGSTPTEIKLLANINVDQLIMFNNKKISIGLNGYNLIVSNPNGPSLFVQNGTFIIDDNGECNIQGAGTAVDAVNSTITITGNVKCNWAESIAAVSADNSNAFITSEVMRSSIGINNYGVHADNSNVTVTGNIECTSTENSYGVRATNGGTVTVDGTITGFGTYIQVGTADKTQAMYTTPTTKTGYLTYTGGTNTVWVKQLDTTPPTVSSVTPNGTGAALSGNIVITFNEVMNTTPGNVRLNTSTALTGGSWNSPTNTIFTIPYSGLAHNTSYTVNISGFKDVSDNTMTANNSNSFTTENSPVITVTALGGSSTYGESPTNPGISIDEFPAGADRSILNDLYNNFSITSTTPVGSYSLEVEGNFSNTEYDLVRNSGTWIVNQATGIFKSIPTLLITYTPMLTLADVELPEGFSWDSPKTSLNAGNNQNFAAIYTDPSGNYTSASGTIQVTVRKAAGADLSGMPILKGIATTSNITVYELTLLDNPGNQVIEYAISIYGSLIDAPTSAALDALKWQSGTTFTGPFIEGVTYYIYARSARNTNYNSGTAQVSIGIKVGDVTGIEEISETEELNAWIQDETLYVSGLIAGKPWYVYNISGILIYKGIAPVETLRATSLRMEHGIYIVKSGNQSIKVVN